MSRILLADDSPHAQRMGERILREEGFEVVTVTDGETALIRLSDVDPDVVMADVFLPHKSGYEICEHIKSHPRHCHTRVVLLAGLLEPVDDAEAQRVRADAILKKPFEASVVAATIRPLAEAAQAARGILEEQRPGAVSAMPEAPAPEEPEALEAFALELESPEPPALEAPAPGAPEAPMPEPEPEPAAAAPADTPARVLSHPVGAAITRPPEVDPEIVRAAVTLALDRATPTMIDEITERVLVALGQ